jgi:hypothetical protein
MKLKNLGAILFTLLILSISAVNIFAADASFSFYPSSGVVKDVNEGFIVDILIDSGSYEISKARAVIKFDPKIVKLREAYRNDNLFEEWVDGETSTDNVNGIVMLTGQTTDIEEKSYYVTEADPDVFARLEFDIVTTNTSKPVVLDFQYSGEDEDLMSVILKSGSPSVNVLTTKPQSASFSIDGADVPDTAIDTNTLGIVIGVILILVGGFVRNTKIDMFRGRRGTIVVSE